LALRLMSAFRLSTTSSMRPTESLGTFRNTSGGPVAEEEDDGVGGGAEEGWMGIDEEARGGDEEARGGDEEAGGGSEVADELPRPARVEDGTEED
jgi:hypothetical protein